MSTIVTRAGKGSPLTNNEVDANFVNLNTDKVQTVTSLDGSIVVTGVGSTIDIAVSVDSPASTLVAQVRNETGATLAKGTVVYISGATGSRPLVSKAIATSDATSAQTFGLITANLSNNQNGYATVVGSLTNLNTSAYANGAQLYLSGTVAGGYTDVKPVAPIHLVYVGIVTRSHATQGSIEVKIQNGYELDELHDVLIVTPANDEVLTYETATGLWKNKVVPSTGDPAGTAVAMAIALG
jgi:ribosomal protein L35AE/L33A